MDKVEEILKKYPYISEDIHKEQEELNKYILLQHEARNTLKGQALSGMPHTSGISDQTYSAVEKIIDRYQEVIDKHTANINELLDQKKWLDKAFSEITEDERRIIYQYYNYDNNGISIREMAKRWHKSREDIKSMVGFAVERIKRIVS